MASLTSCRLNLAPPPSSASPSQPSKTTHVAWRKSEKSLKNQCVMGMACVIIGLEMGNFVSGDHNLAIAEDLKLDVVSKEKVVGRWSDERSCSPWQMNSLETIVPENLPRPSAHRRWGAVGLSKAAPAVKFIVKANTDCFSM